jgi:hypothetical protein
MREAPWRSRTICRAEFGELPLKAFEFPPWLVEPAVRSCRLFNTVLDFVFYDVPTLRAALAEKDASMQALGEKPPSRIIDFDALSDPEGSLLLIDATTAPYVHKYQSVRKFLESSYQESRDVDIASITGVGSSALGIAALAWNISVALEKPVLAIVPGYGVADVVLQGLGGWFAFGLHDFLSSKALIQTGLARAAPETGGSAARISASTSSVGMPRSITQMRFALPYWASILRSMSRSVAPHVDRASHQGQLACLRLL